RYLGEADWRPATVTLAAETGGGEVRALAVEGRAVPVWTAAQREQWTQALALRNEAQQLASQNRLAQAVDKAQQAVDRFQKVLPADPPDVAYSLNYLGGLLRTQGQLAVAQPYIEQALALRQKALPADHPLLALSLNNLGYLRQAQHQLDAARPYFEQALAIRQ